jgi:hypothetical protein
MGKTHANEAPIPTSPVAAGAQSRSLEMAPQVTLQCSPRQVALRRLYKKAPRRAQLVASVRHGRRPMLSP